MVIKTRRLAFDVDNRCTRLLSPLEIATADRIFEKVMDVLKKNDCGVLAKHVTYGNCSCEKHRKTQFILELDTPGLEIDTMHEIESVLRTYFANDIQLSHIITRRVKGRKRPLLDLVIAQLTDKSAITKSI